MQEKYWNDIPIGKENAISYTSLSAKWNTSLRGVRRILHELSLYDSDDYYILIRSSHVKGFYRTNNEIEIQKYKQECLNKARNILAPMYRINKIDMIKTIENM